MFLSISPNFRRFVLGCIDSYDSYQRLILQRFNLFKIYKICIPLHLFAPLHRSKLTILNFFARIFSIFLIRTSQILQIFIVFGTDFDEIVSEFHRNFANCVFCHADSEKFDNFTNWGVRGC